ncbi:Copper(I)-binding protein (fragment) [Methylocella tundrae]|uniref:Copper(I)-binding protein n=1 Tax=Methylocella tundrae TaxID=227605 RepID=A0A8B6MBD5_METTU
MRGEGSTPGAVGDAPAAAAPALRASGSRVEASVQLLERFPIEWSHSIDQKSLQIQKLEYILVDQIEPI